MARQLITVIGDEGQTVTPPHRRSEAHVRYCGSTNTVGSRFQAFGINDLELVAQIFPRWNRVADVADWLREAERFSTAA